MLHSGFELRRYRPAVQSRVALIYVALIHKHHGGAREAGRCLDESKASIRPTSPGNPPTVVQGGCAPMHPASPTSVSVLHASAVHSYCRCRSGHRPPGSRSQACAVGAPVRTGRTRTAKIKKSIPSRFQQLGQCEIGRHLCDRSRTQRRAAARTPRAPHLIAADGPCNRPAQDGSSGWLLHVVVVLRRRITKF